MYEARQNKEKVSRRIIQKAKNKGRSQIKYACFKPNNYVFQCKLKQGAKDSNPKDILTTYFIDFYDKQDIQTIEKYTNILDTFHSIEDEINFIFDITNKEDKKIFVNINQQRIETSFDTMTLAIEELKRQVFISFKDDVDSQLYNYKCTKCNDIRNPATESLFNSYCKDTTLQESIQQTIAAIDLSGTTKTKYTRHDYQDSTSNINLQIQLGGSTIFNPPQWLNGRTSETLVVIEKPVWDELRKYPMKLLRLIKTAHKISFENRERIDICSFEQIKSKSSEKSSKKSSKKSKK